MTCCGWPRPLALLPRSSQTPRLPDGSGRRPGSSFSATTWPGPSHRHALPAATESSWSGGPVATASVWPHAVAVGAEDVVWLPDREAELIEWLGACLDGVRRAIGVAIVGGSGGCGAAT